MASARGAAPLVHVIPERDVGDGGGETSVVVIAIRDGRNTALLGRLAAYASLATRYLAA
jgi:hypothetical protein